MAVLEPEPEPEMTPEMAPEPRPLLSVAPMMAWTTHHYRAMARLLSKRALLYTEMYPVDAVLAASAKGDAALAALLAFDPAQKPLAVQLGGSDPETMGAAAELCARFGYDEINLNIGCPSGKVHDGGFGACLMEQPALVQQLAAASRRAVPAHVAVTVKHRHHRLGPAACRICSGARRR